MKTAFAGMALFLAVLAATASAATAVGPASRKVTDMAGRVLALPGEVKHVACMDVLCYQKLFMLGASDRAVMIYRTDAPWMNITNPDAAAIHQIAGEPNMEELLLRKVDVAFFAYDIQKTTQKLASIGIPGVVSQAGGLGFRAKTMEDFTRTIKRQILVYGEVLGGRPLERAKAWCRYFDERVRFVTDRTRRLPEASRTRMFYMRGPTTLETHGKGAYVYWYGKMAGAQMVVENEPYFTKGPTSMESLLLWDPEVVLVGRSYSPNLVLNDPRWKNIKAVRTGRVYPSPSGVFYWDGGLEGVLLMQYLAKKLYPRLFEDLDLKAEVRFFYRQFYNYALSEEQAEKMLAGLGPDGVRRPLYNN
ncbi:MAG: ABC transporter substrate-binding protein [Desulfobulbus sp.]